MAAVTSKRIRFTVPEYFRMAEAGVFDGRRVELLDGRIFRMHAQSNPHRAAMTKTGLILGRYFGDTSKYWLVYQGTCVLEPTDAPDPDFHIFDVAVGTRDEDLPTSFLVIEVSYSTYRRDSGIKLRRYAANGIQDYWILNIPEKRVEVYREPENPTGRKQDWRYALVRHFGIDEQVPLLAYPDIKLSVRDMLP